MLHSTPPFTQSQVDLILEEQKAQRIEEQQASKNSRDVLIRLFMSQNISKVRVEFSGCGDSGSIEEIDITWADGIDRNEEANKATSSVDEKAGWGDFLGLKATIREWSDEYLGTCNVDWYNNDGGQGHIEFDMTNVPFKFECSIDQNISTSENAYYTEEVA